MTPAFARVLEEQIVASKKMIRNSRAIEKDCIRLEFLKKVDNGSELNETSKGGCARPD